MALKISKVTDEGFTVEYWRVSPVMTVDMVARTGVAQVLVYKDAAARQSGKRPVTIMQPMEGLDEVRHVQLDGSDFETAIVTGDLRAAMYGKLKAKDFFTGSEDV